MKVICIRFNSGEEIIAKLVEDGIKLDGATSQYDGPAPWRATGEVTIDTVRGVTFQPMGQNQVGIAFIPWAVGNTEAKVTINLDTTAVAVYPATSDLEKGYLEQTSGIALARPGMKM